METIEHIFLAFGGSSKFATALGLKNSTASEMRRRKTIPVKYWPILIAAAKTAKIRGVSNDLLANIHNNNC